MRYSVHRTIALAVGWSAALLYISACLLGAALIFALGTGAAVLGGLRLRLKRSAREQA